MNDKHRKLLVVAVLLLAVTGIGAAAWTQVPASGDIPVQTNSGFTATFQDVSKLPADPFQDDQTITVAGGTLSSSGTGSVAIASDFDISGNRTITVRSAPEDIFINKTNTKNVAVQGSVDQITVNEGIAVNDGSDDLGYQVSGSADITVDGLQAGTAYQIVAADGTVLALDSADASGAVTFSDVREGSYSNIEIRTGVLEIRSINETPQLIDNKSANVTVRLFEEDEERVIVRETDDGTVSLGGFPDNTQFSVLVEADGYETRRSVIDSVREQTTVYLLDENRTTSQVRFNVDDRTGEFSGSSQATIQIERSINTSDSAPGTEQYQVVAGDVVGGQLTFDTRLENNVRYRVSVSNVDGDSRQLGAFSVQGDRAIDLVISGIDQGVDNEDGGVAISANKTELEDGKRIEFALQDPEAETTEVNVRIENAVNSSDVIDTASETGEISEFKYSQTVTGEDANKQLVANYSYVRGGHTTEARIPFGQKRFPVLTNLSQGWQEIFGVGFLLVLAGIFSVGNARIGALVIPGVALLLNIIGFLDGVVTVFGVGVAFSLAVGLNLVRGGGGP